MGKVSFIKTDERAARPPRAPQLRAVALIQGATWNMATNACAAPVCNLADAEGLEAQRSGGKKLIFIHLIIRQACGLS